MGSSSASATIEETLYLDVLPLFLRNEKDRAVIFSVGNQHWIAGKQNNKPYFEYFYTEYDRSNGLFCYKDPSPVEDGKDGRPDGKYGIPDDKSRKTYWKAYWVYKGFKDSIELLQQQKQQEE